MNKKPLVNFMSWILTGSLAGVLPGRSREDVIEMLGTPGGWGLGDGNGDVSLMDAYVWGYGIWTLYFENDILDTVTCAIRALDEAGWYFDVVENDQPFFNDIDGAESILKKHGIPYVRLGDYFKVKTLKTGELLERRRRLSSSTILAGDEFCTRIIFDDKNGRVDVIGNPFNLRRQVLGFESLDPKNSYILVQPARTSARVREQAQGSTPTLTLTPSPLPKLLTTNSAKNSL